MLDDDIVLMADSEPFLASTDDVTAPRVVGAFDGQKVQPHTLSAAAVKLSRAAVAALGKYWQAVTSTSSYAGSRPGRRSPAD